MGRALPEPVFPPLTIGRTTAGLATAAAIATTAQRAGSLAPSGAGAAFGVGSVAMVAGWRWGALLIGFFGSSTTLSRWRRAHKEARVGAVVAKGGTRDARQVLANGGLYAIAVGVGALTARDARRDAWLAGAAAGALGAAAADTWATEIGTALGGVPRTVRGWQPVPVGTSGAVSLEGTLGLAAGAGAMGALVLGLGLGRATAAGAVIGGLAGAMTDTLAGATVQERRWCDTCAEATEQIVHARCGQPTRIMGGTRAVDNDAVNVLCTLVGAAVGAAVAARLARR